MNADSSIKKISDIYFMTLISLSVIQALDTAVLRPETMPMSLSTMASTPNTMIPIRVSVFFKSLFRIIGKRTLMELLSI